MFDPKKYVDADAEKHGAKSNKLSTFIEKRNEIIDYLNNVKPLILKECASMEKTLENNPNHPAKPHFEEKIKGWSNILVGLEIVTHKYK